MVQESRYESGKAWLEGTKLSITRTDLYGIEVVVLSRMSVLCMKHGQRTETKTIVRKLGGKPVMYRIIKVTGEVSESL